MKEIRILLIGRTGDGRSSVGNNLLGWEEFPVSHTSQSCTSKCDFQKTIRYNVNIVVYDTPGIFDTRDTTSGLVIELIKKVCATSHSLHVIAFVLGPDGLTDLQQTQKLFFEWFGKSKRSHACLIFTHCTDVARYAQDPTPSLQALIHACGRSVFPFDNTAALDIKEKQVRHFLQYVTQIICTTGGESMLPLQDACVQNMRVAVQSIGCTEKEIASTTVNPIKLDSETGNLKIYDDETGVQNIRAAVQSIGCTEKEIAPTTVNPIKLDPETGNLNIYDDETGVQNIRAAVQSIGCTEKEIAPTTVNPIKLDTETGNLNIYDDETGVQNIRAAVQSIGCTEKEIAPTTVNPIKLDPETGNLKIYDDETGVQNIRAVVQSIGCTENEIAPTTVNPIKLDLKTGNQNIIYDKAIQSRQDNPIAEYTAVKDTCSETSVATTAVKPRKPSTPDVNVSASFTGQPVSASKTTTVSENQSTRICPRSVKVSAGSEISRNSHPDQPIVSSTTPANLCYGSTTLATIRLHQYVAENVPTDNITNMSDNYRNVDNERRNDEENVKSCMHTLWRICSCLCCSGDTYDRIK